MSKFAAIQLVDDPTTMHPAGADYLVGAEARNIPRKGQTAINVYNPEKPANYKGCAPSRKNVFIDGDSEIDEALLDLGIKQAKERLDRLLEFKKTKMLPPSKCDIEAAQAVLDAVRAINADDDSAALIALIKAMKGIK